MPFFPETLMSRKPVTALLCAALLAGGVMATAQGQEARRFGSWGVDLSARDLSVRPGDNFFRYTNGTWLKSATIPNDRASIGGFVDLQILSEQRLRAIVDGLRARPVAQLNVEERKLRDFYDSFLDTAAIEAKGLEPLKKDLDMIAGLKTHAEVARVMASPRLAAGAIFGYGIGIDDKNPGNYSLNLVQAGLGLPDRDYYLSDNPALVKTRDAYRKFLTDMMALGGLSDAAARADRLMALETEIARAHWNRADRRDADKIYNPMPVSALKAMAPAFPWDDFLAETGIPLTTPTGPRQVIVQENTAFAPLAKIFAATPVSTWRDYLTVQYLHNMASYLPKRFDDLNFGFYGTVLSGRTAQLDRATRGVRLLDSQMGEALGKLYVARYFPPDAKAKANTLVSNLLKSLAADIPKLDWMSEATKAKALEKVRLFTPKIGYPDTWRDYAALQVVPGDLVGNIQRASLFEYERQVKRINLPVDRGEWGMTPSTINAYFYASLNEIVFPAAILQPPFFDPAADDAVNYGGIGAVIGHEISHGFDDQGSKYDGHGVFQDWWTKEDRANFDARAQKIIEQYDAFEPLPGLHVIGKNTVGENIADNAGLAIAYRAYKLSLGAKPAPVIDGVTGDQRFFLGFAQVWRTLQRENAIRTQTLSDEHTVAEFRVIGTVRNMDAWYDAFGVTPDQKYYLPPAQRVRMW
jgi:putative endopeptidase